MEPVELVDEPVPLWDGVDVRLDESVVHLLPEAPREHQRRMTVTVSLCAAFWAMGMVIALLGTTLIDLAHQTNSTVSRLAVVFATRSIGYFVCSMLSGVLLDRIRSPCVLLSVAMLLNALSCTLVPFTATIATLALSVSLQGMANGLLDTGGNMLLLRLWGLGVGPYMQALHASYGLGAFLSTLMASRFISTALPAAVTDCETTTTPEPMLTPTDWANITAIPVEPFDTHIHTVYWLVASFMLPLALLFVTLARATPKEGEPCGRVSVTTGTAYRVRGRYFRVMVALAFLFVLGYIGLELAFGGYLFSYAVKYCPLQFTESNAVFLTSEYWGFYALGRVVAIPLSMCCSSSGMIVMDLSGALFATLLMYVKQTNPDVLWMGTALFGLSVASLFPSIMSLLEEYIEVSGRTTSILIIGGALGEVTMPLIIGLVFGIMGPKSFMLIVFTTVVAALCVFVVLRVFAVRGVPRSVVATE